MRSTRNQPFCWQEKKILRLLKKHYKGNELAKFRNLYMTLTEIDSDFNGKKISYYSKTIATYSGLTRDWIPKGLQVLQKLKIVEFVAKRENGKFKSRQLIFTPENVQEIPLKTVTGKTVHGKTVDGNPTHKKIFLSEDSSKSEDKEVQPSAAPVSVPVKSKKQEKPEDKKYLDLAELLYNEHKNYDPKFLKGKNLQVTFNSWAGDIRLLCEKDDRPYDSVQKIIVWCQRWNGNEGFSWRFNVLSGAALRRHYPKLLGGYMKDKKIEVKSPEEEREIRERYARIAAWKEKQK